MRFQFLKIVFAACWLHLYADIAAQTLKVRVESRTSPTEWNEAHVVDINVKEATIPTQETLAGYEADGAARRRFYVMNNAQGTFSFVDLELKANRRQFQKPCMAVGEVIHYRTHSETLAGEVKGHPEWTMPKMTVTYVDLRPKNPACLALKLVKENSK
jgi:hypothetical protein